MKPSLKPDIYYGLMCFFHSCHKCSQEIRLQHMEAGLSLGWTELSSTPYKKAGAYENSHYQTHLFLDQPNLLAEQEDPLNSISMKASIIDSEKILDPLIWWQCW